MSDAPPRRRSGGWLVGGVLVAVTVAVAFVAVFTATAWGRERVLIFLLGALSSRVEGDLSVERLEGNLLAGAKLFGVDLRARDGAPFLRADSAYLDYELPTLVGGDIVIEKLFLWNPELYLRRLPGDTLWNYQKIFPSAPEDTSATPGRAVLIRESAIGDGRVTLELPWEPSADLSPAVRTSEIAEALADTSRLLVERVPGGFLRTIRVAIDELRLAGGVIAPEERGGRFFEIPGFVGTLWIWRDPFPVRYLEGSLALREDRLEFRVSPVLLADSRLAAEGVVDLSAEELAYDISVEGERLSFSDLRPLYPRLPEEGSVRLNLTYETHPPQGTLVLVRELLMVAPGTRIEGELSLLLGDTLRFFDTDLRAPELRASVIEQMLPVDVPVRGLRIGALEIDAPAS